MTGTASGAIFQCLCPKLHSWGVKSHPLPYCLLLKIPTVSCHTWLRSFLSNVSPGSRPKLMVSLIPLVAAHSVILEKFKMAHSSYTRSLCLFPALRKEEKCVYVVIWGRQRSVSSVTPRGAENAAAYGAIFLRHFFHKQERGTRIHRVFGVN